MNFVESTTEGYSITVSDRGEKIPLDRDMKVGFDDIGGARVWVERRDGHITCAAALPESTEPVTWRFDVSKQHVHTAYSPIPFCNVESLEKLITDCRVGLNGKL